MLPPDYSNLAGQLIASPTFAAALASLGLVESLRQAVLDILWYRQVDGRV